MPLAVCLHPFNRSVAQPGSASHWGCGGRRFKSSRSDQIPVSCSLMKSRKPLQATTCEGFFVSYVKQRKSPTNHSVKNGSLHRAQFGCIGRSRKGRAFYVSVRYGHPRYALPHTHYVPTHCLAVVHGYTRDLGAA